MSIDWGVVLATFLGPIAAVQLQKYLERRGEKRGRQLQVFRALMRTRAQFLSTDYVAAFNAVPIDFHGDADVINAWKNCMAHTNRRGMSDDAWGAERKRLEVTLIRLLAQRMGYRFMDSEIADDIYSPVAHGEIELDQREVLRGFAKVFRGGSPFPMSISNLPQPDPNAQKQQEVMQAMLIEWLDGKRAPKTESAKQ